MCTWDRVFSNCLQKMALTPDNEVPLPENIQAYVNTTLAWDNIDRPQETLSGAGTLHRVNGIAIQARHFGPNLPPLPGIGQARTKKRSIDPSVIWAVPPYNAGDRCGPRERTLVEVKAEEILAEARSKKEEFALDLSATGQDSVAGQDSIFPFVTRFKSRRMSSDLC